MNKKVFLLAIAMLPTMLLSAQTTETKVKGAHPWRNSENTEYATEMSNWSLFWNAGFNSFDGDFNSEMKHPVYAPSLGMGVEYTFTSYLGLGLDYKFDMYRVTGNTKSGDNANILLSGYMHRAGAYLSIDLLNGFAPKLGSRIASLSLLAGGGCGFYRNTKYFSAESRNHTASYDALSMDKYKALPYVRIGLDVEFNLSRSIALGLRGEYAYYIKDDIDGRYTAMDNQGKLLSGASSNNDGIVDVTLSLRYKIDAVRKTHIRNLASSDDLQRKLIRKEVADALADANMGRDSIIIYHDTVIYHNTEVEKVTSKDESYYVYFEHGKSNLDDNALITIQQIASRVEEDTTQYLFIYGYCDNTGSLGVNTVLGEARAERVAKELTSEYNIADDHVATCGRGIIVPKSGKSEAYAANRRAELRVVTKEQFDKLVEGCQENKQVKQTAVVEKEERTADMPDWAIASETVTTETTLAKLARKYYGNTHCWVYIYTSNKSTISNPNNLVHGSKIYMPQLNDEQRAITKDKCLQVLRNNK